MSKMVISKQNKVGQDGSCRRKGPGGTKINQYLN